jgi:hypothetical protein
MTVTEIRKIARTLGIKTAKLRKGELILAIQTEERNFPCFGTALGGECDQGGCCWREDCLKPAA